MIKSFPENRTLFYLATRKLFWFMVASGICIPANGEMSFPGQTNLTGLPNGNVTLNEIV
jgi:hypothetical protein